MTPKQEGAGKKVDVKPVQGAVDPVHFEDQAKEIRDLTNIHSGKTLLVRQDYMELTQWLRSLDALKTIDELHEANKENEEFLKHYKNFPPSLRGKKVGELLRLRPFLLLRHPDARADIAWITKIEGKNKAVIDPHLRMLDAEGEALLAIKSGDSSYIKLGTAWIRYEGLNAFNRLRVWEQADPKKTKKDKMAELQEIIREIDDRIRMIQYEESLVSHALQISQDIGKYNKGQQKKSGKPLRKYVQDMSEVPLGSDKGGKKDQQELKKMLSNLETKEKKFMGMLLELKSLAPLLSKLLQLSMCEEMLKDHKIAVHLDTLIKKGLGNKTYEQLKKDRQFADDPNIAGLSGLPSDVQGSTIAELRAQYFLLEQQTKLTTLRLKETKNIDLEITENDVTKFIETLNQEVEKDSAAYAKWLPEKGPAGKKDEKDTLDILHKGFSPKHSLADRNTYKDHAEKRLRDLFRVTEPWKMANGKDAPTESKLADNLYIETLTAHQKALTIDMLRSGNAEQLPVLIDSYEGLINVEMQLLYDEMFELGNWVALHSTERGFGPLTRVPRLNLPELSDKEREHYRKHGLPEDLKAELAKELHVYTDALNLYFTSLILTCKQHEGFAKEVRERFVAFGNYITGKIDGLVLLLYKAAWVVPDHVGIGDANLGNAVRKLGGDAPWAKLTSEKVEKLLGQLEDFKKNVQTLPKMAEGFEEKMKQQKETVGRDTDVLKKLQTMIDPKVLALAGGHPKNFDVLLGERLKPEEAKAYQDAKTKFMKASTEKEQDDAAKVMQDLEVRIANEYVQEVQQKIAKGLGVNGGFNNEEEIIQAHVLVLEILRTIHLPLVQQQVQEFMFDLKDKMATHASKFHQLDLLQSMLLSAMIGALTTLGVPVAVATAWVMGGRGGVAPLLASDGKAFRWYNPVRVANAPLRVVALPVNVGMRLWALRGASANVAPEATIPPAAPPAAPVVNPGTAPTIPSQANSPPVVPTAAPVVSPGVAPNIPTLDKLDPTIVQFRSVQERIALLEKEKGMQGISPARKASIDRLLEHAEAQRSRLQKTIMDAMSTAEEQLPGPAHLKLRGDVAERLLGRDSSNPLTAQERRVITDMHRKGEEILEDAIENIKKARTNANQPPPPDLDIHALRKATAAEVRALDLTKAEKEALINAKQQRLIAKASVLKQAAKDGRWKTTDLAADIETLCRSGVTGKGLTPAATGMAEVADKMGWGRRILISLGIAAQVAVGILDTFDLVDAQRVSEKNEKKIREALDTWAEQANSHLVRVRKGVYEFREDREDPDTVRFKINLHDLNTDARKTAAKARVTADAVGLGATAGLLFFRVSGPWGWGLTVAEITVRVGIDSWEYAEYLETVRNCPLPILLRIGGAQALTGGHDEHDLLGGRMARIFRDPEPALRRKLVFSYALRQIAKEHPEHFGRIAQGMDIFSDADEFLHDFEENMLQPLTAFLFLEAHRADIPWNRTKDLSFQHDFPLMDAIRKEDFDRAIARLAPIWAGHCVEKQRIAWQRDLTALQTQLQDQNLPPEKKAEILARQGRLQQMLYTQGFTYMLGSRLRDADDDIARNGGKTRSALIGQSLFNRLERASGETWIQKRINSNREHVRDTNIPELDDIGTYNAKRGVFETNSASAILSARRRLSADVRHIHGLNNVQWRDMGGSDEMVFEIPPPQVAIPRNSDLHNQFPHIQNAVRDLEQRSTRLNAQDKQLKKEIDAERKRAEKESEEPDLLQFQDRMQELQTEISLYFYDLRLWEAEGKKLLRVTTNAEEAVRGLGNYTPDIALHSALTKLAPGQQAWLGYAVVYSAGGVDAKQDEPVLRAILQTTRNILDLTAINIRRTVQKGPDGDTAVFHVEIVRGDPLSKVRPQFINIVQQAFTVTPEGGMSIGAIINTANRNASITYSMAHSQLYRERVQAQLTAGRERFRDMNEHEKLKRAMQSRTCLKEIYRADGGIPMYGVGLEDGSLCIIAATDNHALYHLRVPSATVKEWLATAPADFTLPENLELTMVKDDFRKRVRATRYPKQFGLPTRSEWNDQQKKEFALTKEQEELLRVLTLPNDMVEHSDIHSDIARILYLVKGYGDNYNRYLSSLKMYARSLPEQQSDGTSLNRTKKGDAARQHFLEQLLQQTLAVDGLESSSGFEQVMRGMQPFLQASAEEESQSEEVPVALLPNQEANDDDFSGPGRALRAQDVGEKNFAAIERINQISPIRLRAYKQRGRLVLSMHVSGDPDMRPFLEQYIRAQCAAAKLPGYPEPGGGPTFGGQAEVQAFLQMPEPEQMQAWLERFSTTFLADANETLAFRALEEKPEEFKLRALWLFLSCTRSMAPSLSDITSLDSLRTLGKSPEAIADAILQRLTVAPNKRGKTMHVRDDDLYVGDEPAVLGFREQFRSDTWTGIRMFLQTSNVYLPIREPSLLRTRDVLTQFHAIAAPAKILHPLGKETVKFLNSEETNFNYDRWDGSEQTIHFSGDTVNCVLPSTDIITGKFAPGHIREIVSDKNPPVVSHGAPTMSWEGGNGVVRLWQWRSPNDLTERERKDLLEQFPMMNGDAEEKPTSKQLEKIAPILWRRWHLWTGKEAPPGPPDLILKFVESESLVNIPQWPKRASQERQPSSKQPNGLAAEEQDIPLRGTTNRVRLPKGGYYVRQYVYDETEEKGYRPLGEFGFQQSLFSWEHAEGFAEFWPLHGDTRVPIGRPTLRLNFVTGSV